MQAWVTSNSFSYNWFMVMNEKSQRCLVYFMRERRWWSWCEKWILEENFNFSTFEKWKDKIHIDASTSRCHGYRIFMYGQKINFLHDDGRTETQKKVFRVWKENFVKKLKLNFLIKVMDSEQFRPMSRKGTAVSNSDSMSATSGRVGTASRLSAMTSYRIGTSKNIGIPQKVWIRNDWIKNHRLKPLNFY